MKNGRLLAVEGNDELVVDPSLEEGVGDPVVSGPGVEE